MVAGTVGLSRDRLAFAVSDRACRPLTTCRPPSLSQRVELTQASRLLQRTHPRTAARCFPAREPVCAERRLPWSSRSLITTKTSGVHRARRLPTSHATFRPRRSSRPRRFTPPPASWACFIPQPRTGFSLQGVSLPTEPYRITPAACPPVVSALPPCSYLRQATVPRLQGFALRGSPLKNTGGLDLRLSRDPLGIFPLRVFARHTVGTPSRPFRPWPSS